MKYGKINITFDIVYLNQVKSIKLHMVEIAQPDPYQYR